MSTARIWEVRAASELLELELLEEKLLLELDLLLELWLVVVKALAGAGGAGAGWTATAVVAVLVFWLPERAASTAAAMEPSSCFTTELMTACSLETWDTWAVTSGVATATGLNKI